MKKYLNSFTDLSKKFYEEKGIPEPKIFYKKKKFKRNFQEKKSNDYK